MLDKVSVYRDSNWRDKHLMFAYNKEFQYYSYIEGGKYLKTGKVVFKEAYYLVNKGMPSKVGLHILSRPTLETVKKVEIIHYTKINIVVVTTDFDPKVFNDEDAALDWIEKTLETHPKCEFKMFEPNQEVKNKPRHIFELITKIMN